MFPIVLEERDLLAEVVISQQEIIDFLEERNRLKDKETEKQDEIIAILTEESNLKSKELNRSKNKTSLFLFAKMPFSSVSPEIGAQLIIKNKLLVSGGVQYNEIRNNVGFALGLGIKLF